MHCIHSSGLEGNCSAGPLAGHEYEKWQAWKQLAMHADPSQQLVKPNVIDGWAENFKTLPRLEHDNSRGEDRRYHAKSCFNTRHDLDSTWPGWDLMSSTACRALPFPLMPNQACLLGSDDPMDRPLKAKQLWYLASARAGR